MVAPAARLDQTRTPHLPRSVASLGRTVLITLVSMMLVVTAWLCIRRLAVRLQHLGFPALLTVGVISAAAVSALRFGWCRTGMRPTRGGSLATVMWLLPTLAVLMLAAALSIRGTSTVALCALWGSLLINELLWGRYGWRIQHADRIDPHGDAQGAIAASPTTRGLRAENANKLLEGSDDGELPPLPSDVSQQITRMQSRQVGDTMAGVLRALFQPGERSQNLHVAFCPPMPSRPTVEVIQLSGPRTRVKAADVQSFGVRFDLRLATASQQEENVLIHFEARCGV